MFDFLFYLFLIGILIASLQDLKKREVDNILNLFLILSSLGYIFFRAIFFEYEIIALACFSLIVMFILANVFYYARIFAGGDAKLLFAMSVFFVSTSAFMTLGNIAVFIIILMISGSLWGLLFSLFLFFRDFDKCRKQIKKEFSNRYFIYIFIAGMFLFILSFINILFLFISVFILFGIILFAFARTIEKTIMIKSIPAANLREGDWLAENIRVKKKIIKPDWEGLSLEELNLLKRLKKKVRIKEGLPFIPGFLIGFLIYVFFRTEILGFLLRLI